MLCILCMALLYGCHPTMTAIKHASIPIDRPASISPDYSGIILPPNIAPLNFMVKESGAEYGIELSSKQGDPITMVTKKPSIRIPAKKWTTLLDRNRGEPLRINVYVRDKRQWLGYKPLLDTISRGLIDRYVTYRTLSYLYNVSRDLRIYERDLGSFSETPLINSNDFAWGCANCHTPKNNDPATFVVQTRSEHFGSSMLISVNGVINKIGSKLGYPAWHPSGKIIAFSAYKVQQCFHGGAARSLIDVYDNTSDIVIYDVEKHKTYAVAGLFQKRTLETWPNWSPDGRFLYFCSAPILWNDFDKAPPDDFDKVKYSLMRIAYDPANGAWGAADTVLSAARTGLSISQPRISPDGRFLLFCMHAYGGYPHTQKSSDLYMLDIAKNDYWKLGVNSDYCESWHGWSENGRWILFSSKRNSGIFTRLYFSYVDSGGRAHKPFIMPQQDPGFYGSFIKCYNYPEFATGPIPFTEKKILKTIRSPAAVEAPLPAAPEAPRLKQNPYIQ